MSLLSLSFISGHFYLVLSPPVTQSTRSSYPTHIHCPPPHTFAPANSSAWNAFPGLASWQMPTSPCRRGPGIASFIRYSSHLGCPCQLCAHLQISEGLLCVRNETDLEVVLRILRSFRKKAKTLEQNLMSIPGKGSKGHFGTYARQGVQPGVWEKPSQRR